MPFLHFGGVDDGSLGALVDEVLDVRLPLGLVHGALVVIGGPTMTAGSLPSHVITNGRLAPTVLARKL